MTGICVRLHIICFSLLAAALLLGGCDDDGYDGPRYVITGGALMEDPAPGPTPGGASPHFSREE